MEYEILPLFKQINISGLCSVYYYECSKNHPSVLESHDFWEMWYLDHGNAYLILENTPIPIKAGEFCFIPPNVSHTLRGDEINNFNIFIISFVCKSPIMNNLSGKTVQSTSKLRELFSEIIDECHNAFFIPIIDKGVIEIKKRKLSPFGSQQMVENLLEIFIINILRQEKKLKNNQKFLADSNLKSELLSSKKKILADIEEYFSNHIYEKICIKDICDTFNYSKTHISTIFKQENGSTIIEHFTQMKIGKAKDLIRENELSLAQISAVLGFSSPGYFSKTFKKVTNMTPEEYKMSLRNYLYYNLK